MNRFSLISRTHKQKDALSMESPAYREQVLRFFQQTVAQDKGMYGDITTQALVDPQMGARTQLVVKQEGIIAGLEEVQAFVDYSGLVWKGLVIDGSIVKHGDVIAEVEGKACDILLLERTILNVIQRLSGIATLTNQYVQLVPQNVLVCPTRKTLWGVLDKKGCVLGGGGTHRLDLSNAFLVKDNHLAFYKDNYEALFDKLLLVENLGNFVEIEVESEVQALAVAQIYQQIILHKPKSLFSRIPFFLMFDNMAPAETRSILEQFKAKGWYDQMYYEASGGINLDTVAEYAATGIDIVSVGGLTHSVQALDVGLEMELVT